MVPNGWKPWYIKVGEIHDPREREAFMQGVGGGLSGTTGQHVLLSIIAGYVGGRIAQRKSDKK